MLDTRPHNIVRNRATAERERGEDWREQAACATHDRKYLWFSNYQPERDLAATICFTQCPVITECDAAARFEKFGMWAGKNRERLISTKTVRPCVTCRRPTRPRRRTAADFPGTVTRATATECHACYTKTAERAKSLPECAHCGHTLRPFGAKPGAWPGAVDAADSKTCADCALKQRREQATT